MPERPKWLGVVGGTEHKSDSSSAESNKVPEVSYEVLTKLWIKVTKNLPADFATSTNSQRVNEAAMQVKPWTVGQLHAYLARPDVWRRPSFTRAVIEEVATRMRISNFSPRE